jgi:hypothetical protein
LLERAFVRLVLVVVVALGLWYVVSHFPGGGKFGCEAFSSTVAHAADAACPNNIGQAAGDARWAAARIAVINSTVANNPGKYPKKYTHGELYEEDGTTHWYSSGQDADADNAEQVGRASGVFAPVGRVAAAEHVEVKVAAQMRTANVMAAVLVINNPAGPCGAGQDDPGVYRCSVVVPKILPTGASRVSRLIFGV